MKKPICPLTKKECLEEGCRWWVHVRGENPQTGEKSDKTDCVIVWMMVLQMEGNKTTFAVQDAIVKTRETTTQIFADGFNLLGKINQQKILLNHEEPRILIDQQEKNK